MHTLVIYAVPVKRHHIALVSAPCRECHIIIFCRDFLDFCVKIAERIRENVANRNILVPEAPNSSELIKISTRTSIGVAIAPVHAEDKDELFLAADKALFKAKEKGRNRVELAEANKS